MGEPQLLQNLRRGVFSAHKLGQGFGGSARRIAQPNYPSGKPQFPVGVAPVPVEGKPKRTWDQSNEVPCRNFANGHCGKGDRCRFKHDKSAVGDNPKKGKHQKRWTPKEDWSKPKTS